MSGRALNAENKVIVLPEPGGPHKTDHIFLLLNLMFLFTLSNYFNY